MQQAADDAVLRPQSPIGLPPFTVPGPASEVLPPLPPGCQPPPFPPPSQLGWAEATAMAAARQAPQTAMGGGNWGQANPHINVMQQLTQQLLNSHATQGFTFYAVVLPEDGPPRVDQYDTIELLQAAITATIGTEVALFPFMGHRLKISKGQWRYLMTPFGNLPLFNVPAPNELEVDETGWVGKQSQELIIPDRPPEADLDDVAETPPSSEGPLFEEGGGTDSPV